MFRAVESVFVYTCILPRGVRARPYVDRYAESRRVPQEKDGSFEDVGVAVGCSRLPDPWTGREEIEFAGGVEDALLSCRSFMDLTGVKGKVTGGWCAILEPQY